MDPTTSYIHTVFHKLVEEVGLAFKSEVKSLEQRIEKLEAELKLAPAPKAPEEKAAALTTAGASETTEAGAEKDNKAPAALTA